MIPIAAKARVHQRFIDVDIAVTHVPGALSTTPRPTSLKTKARFIAPTTLEPVAGIVPVTAANFNSPEPLQRFAAYMIEREAARKHKGAGQAPPHSTNKILAEKRFCNYRRQDDRGSRWVTANILEPYRDHPDLWFLLVAYRCGFNHSGAMAEILPHLLPYDRVRCCEILEARETRNETCFSPAYKLPLPPQGGSQLKYVLDEVLEPIWQQREQLQPTANDTCSLFGSRLEQCHEIGPFLTGQVVADLKQVPPFCNAPDRETYARPGPGSKPGLNCVRGRPAKASWSGAEWYRELIKLCFEVAPLLEQHGLPRIDLQDLQNNLCEFQKYEKYVERGGKGGRVYWQEAKPKVERRQQSKLKAATSEPAAAKPAPEKGAPPAENIPEHILNDPALQASSATTPDRNEAALFLATLDPAATRFTFQTFDDNKERKDKGLARVLHGTLDQHFGTLAQLNQQGAGIYVTINETDFRGRKAANIVRVRALFVDLDGQPLDPVLAFKPLPHLITETSPGRWHAYWLAKDVALDAFTPSQKALLEHFKGDKSVHDLSRVMRLPGFFNSKPTLPQSFMARIIRTNDAPACSLADFDFTALAAANKITAAKAFGSGDYPLTAWSLLNAQALANLHQWVPALFGDAAKYQPGTKGYRISSEALGRDLEEDLSIHPDGIKDFGVHDLGDERQGKRSPLDLVMEFLKLDLNGAFDWLSEQLHGESTDGEADASAEANNEDAGASGAAGAGSAQSDTGGYSPPPWPTLDPVALRGLAGDVVATIEPHTEADPVALLLQYLASFGNVIGRGRYYRAEETQHFGNLFAVLVGDTSKSRKGTSTDRISPVLAAADPIWFTGCVKAGMSTGEGVIAHVRDEVYGLRKGVQELIDPGVADKRLLLQEHEFFQVLAVMKREGNTLSRVIRDAWDSRERLQTLTKHSPTKATGALISIVAHITIEELRAKLDETAMANGFANRFLFACVRRSKLLPFGSALAIEQVQRLGVATRDAAAAARQSNVMAMSPAAQTLWCEVYPELARSGDGLLAHITSRAEAQTVRLALLYALLDRATMIEAVHLEAALAAWRYCEASARFIFGELLGDTAADTILQSLRRRKPNGMAKSEIFDLFGRNLRAANINAALALLERAGKARCEQQTSVYGRAREMWFAI